MIIIAHIYVLYSAHKFQNFKFIKTIYNSTHFQTNEIGSGYENKNKLFVNWKWSVISSKWLYLTLMSRPAKRRSTLLLILRSASASLLYSCANLIHHHTKNSHFWPAKKSLKRYLIPTLLGSHLALVK